MADLRPHVGIRDVESLVGRDVFSDELLRIAPADHVIFAVLAPDHIAGLQHARYYRDEWAKWLRRPVSDIVHLLTDDDSEYADALRKMSPFIGVITPAERDAIYRTCAARRSETRNS